MIFFCGFLGELCYTFIEAFQDCFSKGVCIRTHFRWYNSNKNELYMKLNLTTLMNKINEEEENFNTLMSNIRLHIYSTSIKELDGSETILEDYKKDFTEELQNLKNTYELLTKLKKIQFEKNNTYKLNDGRTIQQAISDNNYLRKLKNFYNSIVNNRSTKARVTEVNNSYFECHNLNYDSKDIQKEIEEITQKIETTDFEISKLNSIEFEI